MFFLLYWAVRIVLFPIYWFRVRGRENLPQGAMVICANHTSLIDPVLLVLALGSKRNFAIMAKAELFSFKPFGAILKWVGAFPVAREKADITAVKHALRALKEGKRLILFPEGTRNTGEEMLEAKRGAVTFSLKEQAPIVPVYITAGKKYFRKSEVIFGRPYIPQSETKAKGEVLDKLSLEMMERIAKLKP